SGRAENLSGPKAAADSESAADVVEEMDLSPRRGWRPAAASQPEAPAPPATETASEIDEVLRIAPPPAADDSESPGFDESNLDSAGGVGVLDAEAPLSFDEPSITAGAF